MPRPAHRTRSKKRVYKASPGGSVKIHYRKEETKSPRCRICGNTLAGIPHLSPSEMRKLNRTKRRIRRIYGGQLCPKCLKTALKQAARTL
ncbi:50S ribosomal protein L34e [Candidatus Bathyarchaeota archaeon]|nr:50S ribosomal protein L34e [Candidatus Bathyarchaeota archaeon]RLI10871.1 MAG: 50S ribosomal protein L34e [Candidatus Bathyarchaeota archaeon]